MTESALVRAILLRFGSHPNLRLWRSQPLVARTREGRVVRALPTGYPDISGIMGGSGRAVFIECKVGRGKLTIPQMAFGAMATQFGAIWLEARSVSDVERGLGLGLGLSMEAESALRKEIWRRPVEISVAPLGPPPGTRIR
jgi:hypothetical protein